MRKPTYWEVQTFGLAILEAWWLVEAEPPDRDPPHGYRWSDGQGESQGSRGACTIQQRFMHPCGRRVAPLHGAH